MSYRRAALSSMPGAGFRQSQRGSMSVRAVKRGVDAGPGPRQVAGHLFVHLLEVGLGQLVP